MAIFSASYRPLAKEAFNCVFRRLTLRKCETGLNTRIRAQITGKLMQKHEKLASFVFKYFETISWIFIIITIVSLGYTAYGGYNYYLYGNCNGPQSDGFCIFDPLGHNTHVSAPPQGSCPAVSPDDKPLSLENVTKELFPQWGEGSNEVFFIGCYACPYTRDAYPDIKKLSEQQNVHFIFGHLPVKEGTEHLSAIIYCVAKEDVSKVAPLNDYLFSLDVNLLSNTDMIYQKIDELGLISHKIQECTISEDTQAAIETMRGQLQGTGIYGTPTVFVNGEPVVGPKPYRVYKRLLK